jgi:hypothetical protein
MNADKPKKRDGWKEFKETPQYRSSPFPFPPLKMNLFEKLDSVFMALVMMVGIISLVIVGLARVFDLF